MGGTKILSILGMMLLLSFSGVIALNQTVNLGLGAINVTHVPGGGTAPLQGQMFNVNRGQTVIVNAVTLDSAATSNFPQQCQVFAKSGGSYVQFQRVDVNATTNRAFFRNPLDPSYTCLAGGPTCADHQYTPGTGFGVFCFNQDGSGYNSTRYNAASFPVQSDFIEWFDDTGGSLQGVSSFKQIEIEILNVTSINESQVPFTVELNNTNGLTAITKTVVDVPLNDTFFYYAVACTTATSADWNEIFGFGYNATRQNVSINGNVAPLEPLITFNNNGLNANLNGTPGTTGPDLSIISIQKTSNTATSTFNTFSVSYNANASTNATIVLLDSNNLITYFLRIETIGTNVSVYQQFPGQPDIFMGSGLKTSGAYQTISIRFFPFEEFFPSGTGFNDEILLGNTTISSYMTFPRNHYAYDGQNFKDAEFTIEGPALVQIRSMGRTLNSNIRPAYTGFQNGQKTTISGVTFTVPAPGGPSQSGDGFTILTDYNGTFYAQCNYPSNGVFTQRHYLGNPADANDYSNFHDITVTVANGTMTTGSGGISGPPGQTGDIFTDSINNALFSIGITGTGPRLLFWFIVSIIVAIIVFKFAADNALFGLLTFVVFFVGGVFIGLVPFWFIIILVILCAAAITLAYRRVAAGS